MKIYFGIQTQWNSKLWKTEKIINIMFVHNAGIIVIIKKTPLIQNNAHLAGVS